MAYADISYGESGLRLTVDGVFREPSGIVGPHMAMEDWTTSRMLDNGLRHDTMRHEWPSELLPSDHDFDVLGMDKQPYQETFDSTEIGTIRRRWLYACGDTRVRVEHDFDNLVVPVLKSDIPDVVPKRCRISSVGIRDPWDDEIVMPEDMRNESIPCIELVSGLAKTMPIEAVIPFTAERGQTTFGCRMRYSAKGQLRRAEVTILRKGQWEVVVSYDAKGRGRVSSCKEV